MLSFFGSVCRLAAIDGSESLALRRMLGLRWLLLADHPQHLVEGRGAQPFAVERRLAGQQLVEQHAQ